MIPSLAGTSEFQSLLFPLLRWCGPADLHRSSLLKPPQMMKGIPPTYTQPGFQSVMAHPKHRCSSSVEGRSLLQTPSESNRRWGTDGQRISFENLKENPLPSPFFAIHEGAVKAFNDVGDIYEQANNELTRAYIRLTVTS